MGQAAGDMGQGVGSGSWPKQWDTNHYSVVVEKIQEGHDRILFDSVELDSVALAGPTLSQAGFGYVNE